MATETGQGMSKTHCLRMESQLPDEVVELILERLPVESLLGFKAVSKQWKTTIESESFKERQLRQRQQSGDPDVLMVSETETESLRRLVLGSSSWSINIPTPWENAEYLVSHGSCDGLVCLYHYDLFCRVVNPTTKWYRTLPLCELQQLVYDLGESFDLLKYKLFKLGFGKDKYTGTYKPVWLYNSFEIGLKNATTCEVFDFSTNAWRYVTPSSPCRVIAFPDPVYVDGSLHWFTECKETKVVSFDLHTETFQMLCETPFLNANPLEMGMCNLDNRLCVSHKNWPNLVIWSFNPGNKIWDKMCSIDLDFTYSSFGIYLALLPLALLEKKKKKLLFYDRALGQTLATYDLETKSYDLVFCLESTRSPVCYFQSLITI